MREATQDNDFNEDEHSNEDIATFYNEVGYTPDDVPTDAEQLDNGDWVIAANPAFGKCVYWVNQPPGRWMPYPKS